MHTNTISKVIVPINKVELNAQLLSADIGVKGSVVNIKVKYTLRAFLTTIIGTCKNLNLFKSLCFCNGFGGLFAGPIKDSIFSLYGIFTHEICHSARNSNKIPIPGKILNTWPCSPLNPQL